MPTEAKAGRGGAINTSIFATHRVVAGEFNAFSDKRIKDIKGLSNNQSDLATLEKIRITDYTLKDKRSDQRPIKKVIAQDLEEIYPQAVSKTTNVVPDIYQLAKMENGKVKLDNTLKKGAKVRLIFSDSEGIYEVLEASPSAFKVNLNETKEVFVYGQEVNDFRMVDYEALTTLNISATQALLKRIEALEENSSHFNALQNDNSLLKARVEKLENAVNALLNESSSTLKH